MPKSPNIRLRENRTSIPPGYVLGRVDPGTGAVQLIRFGNLAQSLLATGLVGSPVGTGPSPAPVLQAEDLSPISAEDGSVMTV